MTPLPLRPRRPNTTSSFTRCDPQVAVNYASSPDKAEEVAAEIAKLGGEAITVGCNVAKRDELDALFKAVTDKWGQVDVLVNNAGEQGGRREGGADSLLTSEAAGTGKVAGAVEYAPGAALVNAHSQPACLPAAAAGRRAALPLFCSGITRDSLMMRMKPEQWQDVIDTNLSSVFYASQVRTPEQAACRVGGSAPRNQQQQQWAQQWQRWRLGTDLTSHIPPLIYVVSPLGHKTRDNYYLSCCFGP